MSRAHIVEDLEDLKEAARALDAPLVAAAVDAIVVSTEAQYWAEVFEATVRCRRELEELERLYVHYARVEGESWSAIGDYLEMSGEGARRKYGAGQKLESRLQALEDLERAEIEKLANDAKLISLRKKRDGEEVSGAVIPPDVVGQLWELQGRYLDERRELLRRAYPEAGA